jgi:peptidoglycan/LPS O-acetylase OafA/YrhL
MKQREFDQERMMVEPNVRFGYRAELDGMRGFAILLVLFYHLGLPWCRGGFVGVDVFFVLSGFLISSLLLREFDETGQLVIKRFYLRRAMRLFPALGLVLVSLMVIGFAIFNRAQIVYCLQDVIIAIIYMTNWARVFNFHTFSMIGHCWSLSIEEQFYLIWPVLFFGLLRRQPKRRLLAKGILALGLILWGIRMLLALNGVYLYSLFHNSILRADALLAGCALAVVSSSPPLGNEFHTPLRKLLTYLAPLALAAICFEACLTVNSAPPYYLWGQGLVEIASVLLIQDLLGNPGSFIRWIFTRRWLVWIGSISYGLYLWHYPIFMIMQVRGVQVLWIRILGTALAFLAAALSYRWLEAPILRRRPAPTTSGGHQLAYFSRGYETPTITAG